MATPKLSYHKAREQYYARFDGKMVYFGKDPAEAHQRFAEALTLYENGNPVTPRTKEDALTIVEASDRFLRAFEGYYPESNEHEHMKRALQRLCGLFGRLPLTELGPKRLKSFQARLVQQGELSRKGINRSVSYVRRFTAWCVSEELCPPSVHEALRTVPPLRRGKTAAPETEPVRPVPHEHIEAAKEQLPSPVQAIVDLLLFTGARPSEILSLRPADIDTSTDPWQTRPVTHKTAWQGRDRMILFGPKAQAVLRPFMLRDSDAYMFSPKESERERHNKATVHRRPNQAPNPRKTKRTLGDAYTSDSLRRAIEYACKKAGVPKWTPYRLRHTAATEIRRQYGLEGAQVVLGHAALGVTQVYAERDFEKAARIISEVG